MSCLRNTNHKRYNKICLDCLETINNKPCEPKLNELEPELRALFVFLRTQALSSNECWTAPQSKFKIKNKTLKAQNLYYAFYKADINNEVLKTTCNTAGCVNPAHNKSRFEKSSINKVVTSGFNRKRTDFTDVSDAQWLREA